MNKKTFLGLFVVAAAVAAGAATFHVNPAAAPDGDGSSAKPFATLAAARAGVRAARQAGKIAPEEAVEIVLAPGDYVQETGFTLEPRDGGANEAAPVVWRAAQAGTARIVGGDEGYAVVSADLGELPSDDIEAFATRMLEANHLFAGTGGAALAVEGDRALLERRIRFAELSRGEGAHVVYPFIGTARSLRHTLREELLF